MSSASDNFYKANPELRPKAKTPTVKLSTPYHAGAYQNGVNSTNNPIFRAANDMPYKPDPAHAPPPYHPAPAKRPAAGNGNAYYTPNPTVQAAINYANQIASGGGGYAPGGGLSPADTQSLYRQASQMVGYELDPQIHAAQAAYNQENRDYSYLIDQLNKQTGVAKGDISSLFNALDVQLGAQQQNQTAAYDKAKTGVTGAYDQLSQMLGSTFTNAQNAATAEQQRLGIQGPGQNTQLDSDKAYLTGLAAEQKANAVSNVNTQAANANSISTQARASASGAAPNLIAQITLAANNQQQQLLKDHIDKLAQYKDQVGLLNSQRGGKIQMVLKQLEDQLYQRQQDAQQLAFMNSIRAGELGLSAGQLSLAQAKLAQEGKQATDAALLSAEKLGLEKQKAGLAGQPKQTGMELAFNYINSAYPDHDPRKLSDLQNALIDAINGNSNDPGFNVNSHPGTPGYGIPGYDPGYLQVYLRDIDSAVTDRAKQGWGPIERNILRNAAMKFFNK